MKIQYFSDIHLEFGGCTFPHTDADVVVAAGDIAPQAYALPWLAHSGKPVIYVAGNHEYFGGDAIYTLAELRRQAVKWGIRFLERDRVEFGGIRFLGTTLWTDYDGASPSLMRRVKELMNDFVHIRIGGRSLEPDDVLRLHVSSLAWLIDELEKGYSGKTVVVTHHAPSLLSWHREAGDPTRYAYCSSLEALADRYAIDLWLHGHTHTTIDYSCGPLRVACNARGYYRHETQRKSVLERCIEL